MDLSEALVFHQMQHDPEQVRALLAKGGPEAVWAWAEKVEADFRRSPSVQDLDEAELSMEFFRTWTPGPDEEALSAPAPPKARLSKLEIARVMSATEKMMPIGLYEALTQG